MKNSVLPLRWRCTSDMTTNLIKNDRNPLTHSQNITNMNYQFSIYYARDNTVYKILHYSHEKLMCVCIWCEIA